MERKSTDRIESERKFWNSKAKDYDTVVNKFFPKIYESVIENLIKDTSQSKNLLEVATGTGILAIKLSNYVADITAIDVSPAMLEIARAKAEKAQVNNIDFRIGDACNLEFKNNSFDTVLASNVLHLLFQPDIALQEMRRVLYDDGVLITPTFCHGSNFKSVILSRIFSILGQKTRSRWNPQSFMKFVENNGFKITKDIYVSGTIPLVYLVAKKT